MFTCEDISDDWFEEDASCEQNVGSPPLLDDIHHPGKPDSSMTSDGVETSAVSGNEGMSANFVLLVAP